MVTYQNDDTGYHVNKTQCYLCKQWGFYTIDLYKWNLCLECWQKAVDRLEKFFDWLMEDGKILYVPDSDDG